MIALMPPKDGVFTAMIGPGTEEQAQRLTYVKTDGFFRFFVFCFSCFSPILALLAILFSQAPRLLRAHLVSRCRRIPWLQNCMEAKPLEPSFWGFRSPVGKPRKVQQAKADLLQRVAVATSQDTPRDKARLKSVYSS